MFQMKEVNKMGMKRSKQDVYFTMISMIQERKEIKEICKKLGISKQSINRYLKVLKASEQIKKIGYGVWEINEKEVNKIGNPVLLPNQKEVNKIGNLVSLSKEKKDVRSHGFSFKVFIPNIANWNQRMRFLEKKKIFFKSILHKRVQSFVFRDHLIWLGDKYITVFFPRGKSYFVESAQTGYNYAIGDLNDLVVGLQNLFNARFYQQGKLVFRVNTQHHALIHNELAKMYNRKREKLRVYDDEGILRLVVDFSDVDGVKLDELEAVSKEYAISDNVIVKRFLASILKYPFTAEDIQALFLAIKENTLAINQQANISVSYAENLEIHVNAIRELSVAARENSKNQKQLTKTVKLLYRKAMANDGRDSSRLVRTRRLLKKCGW